MVNPIQFTILDNQIELDDFREFIVNHFNNYDYIQVFLNTKAEPSRVGHTFFVGAWLVPYAKDFLSVLHCPTDSATNFARDPLFYIHGVEYTFDKWATAVELPEEKKVLLKIKYE